MKEKIRDYIIISGNRRIKLLLKVVNEKPNLEFTELSRELKKAKPKGLSGGSLWHTLKDARLMELIKNGYGFHLTEIGEKFLNNFSQEINKQAHLNVPLFKRCYEEIPNETNHTKVRDWFLPHLENFEKKLRGSVIRRYLEGVYDVDVKKRPRVNIKQYKTSKDYTIKPASATASSSGGGGGGGGYGNITYFDFFKSHNFSDEKIIQILTIISNIPEDKKETSLKLLLKEIKI